MRGDSLRDLYAKTLALLGLCLLGAIGALVDYWTSSAGNVPVVSGTLAGPPLPAAIPPQALDLDVPLPPLPAAQPSPPAVVVAPEPVAPPVLAVAASWAVPGGFSDAALASPPLRTLAPPNAATALPVMELALSVPDVPTRLPESLTPVFAASTEADDDDSGFFSDAADGFRKAGSTIAQGTIKAGSTLAAGTMKAGAPIVSVVKMIGGAFRKIGLF